MERVRLAVSGLGVTLMLLSGAAGCANGPSTQDEVCVAFAELGNELTSASVCGNPVFSKAEDLADLAERYEGTPSLARDAKALKDIADSERTSGAELMDATQAIAELCGHPLGINPGYGG